MKHFKITITGRIQGVWYRGSTRQKANELGLKGFVKNEPNGSVYTEVEGEESVLVRFLEWCKKGPELARVEDVTFKEGSVQGYEGFEVRR